jgi:tRNA threonylcarbamoyladenosine biosynthesis protein TsaE
MSNGVHLKWQSGGQAATEAIGERIGSRLRGGEVFDLSSDLGGGKTALVRGLARGAGSEDQVASPTFTVSKLYEAGKLHIHHFDFYRLPEAGIMIHEIAELIEDTANVIIVEWSAAIAHILPADHVSIAIERVSSGEDDRRITIAVPEQFSYLFEEDKTA